MKTAMLGLLAETSIHPGSGRGSGIIDLPVAREAATDYPVLVGSSLKGALRDKARTGQADDTEERFGKQDQAGDLLISDARLLLLPVRSLTGSYRWATCPHLIERYFRDCCRAGLMQEALEVPQVCSGSVLTSGKGELFLEERQFQISDGLSDELIEAIKQRIRHDSTWERLKKQVTVLHDDDFAWFARYGLNVQARNVLEKDTKKSRNLWYEETLPADTLMYALVTGRNDAALDILRDLFPKNDSWLQAGGNETVGQGWFSVALPSGDAS